MQITAVVRKTSKEMDNISRILSSLTKREQECLLLFLNGNTAKESAQILNLSFRTIEEHLHKLKQKFGCRYIRNLHALFPHSFQTDSIH